MIIAAAFLAGMILGIVIVVVGVAVYLKRQKAQALRPPESLGLDYSVYHTTPDPEPLQVPGEWDGSIKIEWDRKEDQA